MNQTGNPPSLLLTSLLAQAPGLSVELLGVVLALALWHRGPMASLLTLLGCALLLVDGLAVAGGGAYLAAARASLAWSIGQYVQAMTILGWAGSLAHAVGVGLLLGAAFTGRRGPTSA